MRRIVNAFLALLIALLLPLGASACGGDDDSQGEGIEPAETNEGAPTGDEVGETQGEGEDLGGEAED